MRPTDAVQVLAALIPTRQPIYFWGPPGVGKSSIVRQACASLEMELIDIRAVLLDPVDLRGLPSVNVDGHARWCPPDFLPRGGKGVLFLDELAQAPPLVQGGCLQLTLDRKIGEYQLPDEWTIIAASNRQEDRAGAHRLITPLLNRFLHLDLEVSNDDWQHWAVLAGVAPEVRSFLNWRPGLLFAFDPSSGARAFPTPRSWDFVSRVLPATPADLLHPVCSGCVGEGPAAEFAAFCKIYRQLPDVDKVLANPTSCTLPTDPAVLFALSGAVVERSRKADDKLLNNIVVLSGRMQDEFGVLTVRDTAACNNRVLQVPAAGAWLKKHRDLLLCK